MFEHVCACFALTISRLSKESAFCFGSAHALRDSEVLENIVGNFLNVTLINVNAKHFEDRTSTLGQLALAARDAQRNSSVPFILLLSRMRASNPLNDASRNVVYQTMLDMLPSSPDASMDSGSSPLEGILDLAILLVGSTALVENLMVQYNQDLFSE
jgi:hypothetical protein